MNAHEIRSAVRSAAIQYIIEEGNADEMRIIRAECERLIEVYKRENFKPHEYIPSTPTRGSREEALLIALHSLRDAKSYCLSCMNKRRVLFEKWGKSAS